MASLGLNQLREVLDREQISVDILAKIGNEKLKQISTTVFGHRYKLIKCIEKLILGKAPAFWQAPPSGPPGRKRCRAPSGSIGTRARGSREASSTTTYRIYKIQEIRFIRLHFDNLLNSDPFAETLSCGKDAVTGERSFLWKITIRETRK